MIKLKIILLLTFLFSSCSEKFNFIDPLEFNKKIEQNMAIYTAEQLMKIYYPNSTSEGTIAFSIESRKIKNGLIETTLIHDGLADDSQRAIKIIMKANLIENKWLVKEIKKNWKCREGRGHTYWGIGRCN